MWVVVEPSIGHTPLPVRHLMCLSVLLPFPFQPTIVLPFTYFVLGLGRAKIDVFLCVEKRSTHFSALAVCGGGSTIVPDLGGAFLVDAPSSPCLVENALLRHSFKLEIFF
ncbi:hypothetical protein V8C42DRAFT_336464 [Trichoderma barbatum]